MKVAYKCKEVAYQWPPNLFLSTQLYLCSLETVFRLSGAMNIISDQGHDLASTHR